MFEFILKNANSVDLVEVDNRKLLHFTLPENYNPNIFLPYWYVLIERNLYGYDVWLNHHDMKDWFDDSEPLINSKIEYKFKQLIGYEKEKINYRRTYFQSRYFR